MPKNLGGHMTLATTFFKKCLRGHVQTVPGNMLVKCVVRSFNHFGAMTTLFCTFCCRFGSEMVKSRSTASSTECTVTFTKLFCSDTVGKNEQKSQPARLRSSTRSDLQLAEFLRHHIAVPASWVRLTLRIWQITALETSISNSQWIG